MCELFAMASRIPATVSLSLEEFSRHGGQTDKHKDGWGIAYYHGPDALLVREPGPASDSACMRFIRSGAFGSSFVLSHIRRATVGALALKNTQPFARELAGRLHLFAHNGMLPGIESNTGLSPGRHHPIGDTDSEYAFCALLASLAHLWTDACVPPRLEERFEVVKEFSRTICSFGPANFIYCDSDVMFVHGDRRHHRNGIHPPGLHYLCRSCRTEPTPIDVPGLNIRTDANSQDIVLAASVPLSDEAWVPLGEGELLALKQGEIIAHG